MVSSIVFIVGSRSWLCVMVWFLCDLVVVW